MPAVRCTSGQSVSEIYSFGTSIGQGNYGIVRTCSRLNEPGPPMACKTIAYSSMPNMMILNDIQREIAVMTQLGSHPNLVELKGVHRDKVGWHLVMELCKGGELFEEVMKRGRFSEQEAAETIRQLASALDCCHSKNVLHRDVKLENILLMKPVKRKLSRRAKKEAEMRGELGPYGAEQMPRIQVKLADFGLAQCLRKNQKISEVAGSPYYMAPEVIKGDLYGFPADIWSLGVVLYALLSGLLPFVGTTNEKIFQAVKRAQVDFTCPSWLSASPEAKNLVLQMLSLDPSKRPTAREVIAHPWVQKNTSKFLEIPESPEEPSISTIESPTNSTSPESEDADSSLIFSQKFWKIPTVFQKSASSASRKCQLSVVVPAEIDEIEGRFRQALFESGYSEPSISPGGESERSSQVESTSSSCERSFFGKSTKIAPLPKRAFSEKWKERGYFSMASSLTNLWPLSKKKATQSNDNCVEATKSQSA